MRLTKLERKAAAAVLVMTATVVVSGVRLLRKHSRYMAQKAAAFFKDEKDEETSQEAAVGKEPEETAQESGPASEENME